MNNAINMSQKTISVAIIGKPNAGKSSLLNKLINHKLSIVTPKVQTTRTIITGTITIDNTQIIIFDTPGIFAPKKQLEKSMVRCAWSSLHSADIVALIIDSTSNFDDMANQILLRLKEQKIQPIFLLNKVDLNSKSLNDLQDQINIIFPDNISFHISAITGKNLDKLSDYIVSLAKLSPWVYEEDDITNLPMRFLAAEITREQLFLNLHDELPYNLTVESENFVNQPDNSIKINQVIIVARETHKIMILGKNGSMIKHIGVNARSEMERIFDNKIHLFLFVKVRKEWENNPESYKHMMLPFAK